jgi:outer membrane protein
MSKKSSVICAAAMAAAFTFGAFGTEAAMAAPPVPPAGGAPVARILMVDLRRVLAESKVGHDMQRQAESLKASATKELEGESKGLERDQVALQQQAAILAADVKARRIKEFEQKREAFQKKVQNRSEMIQLGVMQAQRQIEQALGPVLQGILRERGGSVLVDRSAVLLAPNALDVTDIAIQRLDTKMSSVKVELVAPPKGTTAN